MKLIFLTKKNIHFFFFLPATWVKIFKSVKYVINLVWPSALGWHLLIRLYVSLSRMCSNCKSHFKIIKGKRLSVSSIRVVLQLEGIQYPPLCTEGLAIMRYQLLSVATIATDLQLQYSSSQIPLSEQVKERGREFAELRHPTLNYWS